jgi:hypothetical protein
MSTGTALTSQMLAWIAEKRRDHAETIDTWKTSCPRLAVWEDALADGLVRIERSCVLATDQGVEFMTSLRQASR